MGKAPRKHEGSSQARLDAVWRTIRRDSDRRHCISLRAAANILGFCIFPVGWDWTEFRRPQDEEEQEYESAATRTRCLEVLVDVHRTPAGYIADATAKQVRRERIETRLLRIIRRNEIRLTLYDEHACGRVASDKILLHPALKLDVAGSLCSVDDLVWSCSVDAIELTNLMDPERWKDERAKQYDWLLIERHIRLYFETKGCPPRKDDVYDHIVVLPSTLSADASEPSSTRLRALIAELRQEYEPSVVSR